MPEDICKSCHKPPALNNAGSITAYFFQQNYCQCKDNNSRPTITPAKVRPAANNSERKLICTNCGKARPFQGKVGSFTSFLFKELRCQCPPSLFANAPRRSQKSTDTRTRVAQRQRFSDSLKQQTDATGTSRSQPIFPPDTIIGGTFKIHSLVGVGGMGIVYLAEHTALHRPFALKVLAPELVNEQNWLRFQAEAKTMAALNHPTFVKVYDLGIHNQLVPFYSMDFLTGFSLEEILAADGPLPLEQALDIFLEVLDGLAYAHRNGIVHRDIKPANIMICTINGARAVKVLDFGIAKLIGRDAIKVQRLTSIGEVFGSPYYMSPEQCVGEPVDNRSDIYSVGCSLFETLTTFVPFDGKSSIDIAMQHQEDEPPLLADVLPDQAFPASLDLVIGKCLEKLPDDRYQSAKELAVDLNRIKEGKNLLAYSPAFAAKRNTNLANAGKQEEQEYKFTANIGKVALLAACVAIAAGTKWGTQQTLKWDPNKFTDKPLPSSTIADTISMGKLMANEQFINTALTQGPDSTTLPDMGVNDTAKYSTIKKVGNVSLRCFNFPKGVSIGTIFRSGKSGPSENARGELKFPAEWTFFFRPRSIVSQYPQYLKRFRAGEVVELQLYPPNDYDKILDAGSNIPALEYLSIRDGANFTPNSAAALSKYKNLRTFNATASNISGTTLAKANCWQQIEKIYWNRAIKPTAMLQKLQSCPKLTVLGIREANLTHRDFQLIGKISSLRLLELAQNHMTADDIKALNGLKNLTYLNLEDCGLTEAAVPALKILPSLRELQISSDSSKPLPTRVLLTLKKELTHIHVH